MAYRIGDSSITYGKSIKKYRVYGHGPGCATVRADEFWEKEFGRVTRVETSDFEKAERFIEENREKIFLLVVFVTKKSPGFSTLISNVDGIPFVLVMRTDETRNQIERILEGRKIQEPFDGALEAWLRKIKEQTPPKN